MLFAPVFLFLSCTGQLPAELPPERQADFLKVAGQAYLHNREGFARFTCRFETTFGKARSWEDALARRLENPCTFDGLWVVDGDKVRFELLCDPEKIPVIAVGHYLDSPFLSNMFLGDSSIQLTVSPDQGIANINPPELPAGLKMTPFDMGWMGENEQSSPGRYILRSLEDKKETALYEGAEKHEGVEAAVVKVGGGKGGRWCKYYMDPKRGFLPVETVVTENDKMSYRYLITDIKSCPGGLWYPAQSLVVIYPFKGEPKFIVKIWEVKEMRLDELPPANPFCINVPKGTTICDASVSTPAQYKLEKDETICLSGLKDVLDKARLIGAKRAGIGGGERIAEHPRSNFGVIVGVNVALAVAIALAVYLRYRKRKSNSSVGD